MKMNNLSFFLALQFHHIQLLSITQSGPLPAPLAGSILTICFVSFFFFFLHISYFLIEKIYMVPVFF